MKSILFIAVIALSMAYCNTPEPTTTGNQNVDTASTVSPDTTRMDTTARRSDTLGLKK